MSQKTLTRAVRITLGVALIPLGIVGLFLPVLQGVLFLLVGLALLASEIPWLKKLQDDIKKRHPGPWDRAERFKRWLGSRLRGTELERDQGRGL